MGRMQKRMDGGYEDFVEKFKPKPTTDDCYTPAPIYDAIACWVANRYGLDRANFVRPFYPGGDYERFEYPVGCVVVDNPPFSIIKQITDFYIDEGILFFLFTPALVLVNRNRSDMTRIAARADITYENGAKVPTNFATNLEPGGVILMTAPDLHALVEAVNAKTKEAAKRELPKYEYPDEVLTMAKAEWLAMHGMEYVVHADDCVTISAMDAQRASKKSVFGGGYLLSERAAAERAAAHKWRLSEREKYIVEHLGGRSRETEQEP